MKLSAGIALLALGLLIPGSARAKTGTTLVEEEAKKQIDKHIESRYTDLIRKCKERKDYGCFGSPSRCHKNFDKFKRECNSFVAYTPDGIIISSGYLNRTIEDNYYIGAGILGYSIIKEDGSEAARDLILFGIRRPKAGKGSNDDEPLYGFIPKLEEQKYKRLDFLHNMFDKSLSKIKPFLQKNHPDGPVTHMINLKKIGSGLIKFKADLGKNKFAIPKNVVEKVPEWKNVEHLNWINTTEPYINAQTWGFHDGHKFTETGLVGYAESAVKVPLTRDNKRQKDVKIDPSYYMPDGSLKRP